MSQGTRKTKNFQKIFLIQESAKKQQEIHQRGGWFAPLYSRVTN
jgi:hypothetical protein